MNDSTIINTISKVHFTIVSFFVFIFLLLSVTFALLQNGIYLENISLPNIKIKQLYIKWNEKLNFSIHEIKIVKKPQENDTKIQIDDINAILKKITLIDTWFNKIDIHKISYGNILASFNYDNNEKGYISISSPSFTFSSSIVSNDEFINMRINNYQEFNKNIFANGNIVINIFNSQIYSNINFNINDDLIFSLFAHANNKELLYKLKFSKDIESIKHTVNILNLNSKLRYWVYEAIDFSSLSIKKVHGKIIYNNLENAYKHIYVNAVAKDLKYKYNKELDSIKTKYTDLEFKNGVLNIRPKSANTYKFSLGQSWLNIDFSKKEELLTLYLKFKGKLNKDMSNLLSTYHIKLPLKQNSGAVDTDLTLLINLISLDVEAQGDFFTKKANFTYLGLDLDIYDAYIHLKNSQITINNMQTSYQEIAHGLVSFNYNTSKKSGDISFKIDKFSLKEQELRLNTNAKKPLNIKYKISKEQDKINIESTQWKYKNSDINIDAINAPFDLEKLSIHLPTTFVDLKEIASGFISGDIDIKPLDANLDVDLLKVSLDGLSLAQSNLPLKLKYNKKLSITSKESIKLVLNTVDTEINNLNLIVKDGDINIDNITLDIDKVIKTKINGNYNIQNCKGKLSLKNIMFKNNYMKDFLSENKKLLVDFTLKNNIITMNEKNLGIAYMSAANGWKLNLNSIDKLHKKSKLLQDYNITNGTFSIKKQINDKEMKFTFKTNYSHQFLIQNNQPIKEYILKGEIDTNKDIVSLNINNKIDVQIDKEIDIKAHDIGVDIHKVIDFIQNHKSDDSTENKNITLKSTNCFINVGKNRDAISDKIDLQYFNNIVTAQLVYKNATAGFKLDNKKFHLYGEGFNDDFMDKLFALSDFKGGKFSFSLDGALDNYKGIFSIKDSTIVDYKVLNNILAFVNTIPSLVSFSLPSYNSKGLHIQDSYMIFYAKDEKFNVTDINIDSEELDILGRGTISIAQNNIDLELNLKTDLGSSLSKVPVVGYILLGKDNISTTLSITGKLDNPNVKSLLAKDIVVAPINIIKRTLLLPFNLFSDEDINKKN